MKRFFIILLFGTILRFYLGENTFSFVWFLLLYLPMINWSVYWVFFAFRVGINYLTSKETITVPGIRKIYTWYINVPGCLVISEIFYLGAKYNNLI